MKVLLDTCVIYPTVMRQMLLGVARQGAFTPLWSARIIEEWQRASVKLGPEGVAQAGAEAALLRVAWPDAEVIASPSLEGRLWLPDPADIHVLAAAIAGSADMIVTLNAKDFPRNVLAEEGLTRSDPDAFLHGIWQAQPEVVTGVAKEVLAEANRLSGKAWEMRALLKKARLPRLAKAVGGVPG
ncbi:PIN domain-containing protein [Pseudohalocynthiibacter aestuariivivens]|uniref:PIN domain-containing protein n=1 Tax=Roseovarius pelagicus TaxID=2980108 RepID=A0ABY6DB79_9RHOB|nr:MULTISPECIES: PIN domain-containing protein [Rhodobacterales]QIE44738.1 PIN domain-containing protein [Pseudohalocynthiibacter aestuariivivens]UXX83350.1 PIN domain-containing protein [Roseovarius pelagicus]